MPDREHWRIGGRRVAVDVLTGPLEQIRGRMFTRSPPEVPIAWRYADPDTHSLHMLGVPYPLKIAFVESGTVQTTVRLPPWIGWTSGSGRIILEYDPNAYAFEAGDSVSWETSGNVKSDNDPLSV